MWTSFTDMAVRWGLPAVILIFWYLHNQQQAKLFEASLEQQKSQTKQMVEMVQMMITQQRQQADQQFSQTQKMLETLQYLSGQVNRIDTKAETNQFCPIVRGESKER